MADQPRKKFVRLTTAELELVFRFDISVYKKGIDCGKDLSS